MSGECWIFFNFFCSVLWVREMSQKHNKTNNNNLCSQRRLRSAWASAQSDRVFTCAFWVAKDQMFLHACSEDSDQTGCPVFAGRTDHFVCFVVLRLKKCFLCCYYFSLLLLMRLLVRMLKNKILSQGFLEQLKYWQHNEAPLTYSKYIACFGIKAV